MQIDLKSLNYVSLDFSFTTKLPPEIIAQIKSKSTPQKTRKVPFLNHMTDIELWLL